MSGGFHPGLGCVLQPITAGLIKAGGPKEASCSHWSQILSHFSVSLISLSFAFALLSPSVDTSGGCSCSVFSEGGTVDPLHPTKNSPYLSSFLRDFGLLMDDHLGH